MPRAERRADVVWEGSLAHGSGRVTGQSGALRDLEVTFPSRIGEPEGRTSPEELIAAAHASCYAMALSNELGQAGHEPERLEVSSTATLDEVGDGLRITTIEVEVLGRVPGLDEEAFQQAVRAADEGCPVSNLLRPAAEIRLNARLAG